MTHQRYEAVDIADLDEIADCDLLSMSPGMLRLIRDTWERDPARAVYVNPARRRAP